MESILSNEVSNQYLKDFINNNFYQTLGTQLVVLDVPKALSEDIHVMLSESFGHSVSYGDLNECNDEESLCRNLANTKDKYDYQLVNISEIDYVPNKLVEGEHLYVELTNAGLVAQSKPAREFNPALTNGEIELLLKLRELGLPIILEGSDSSVVNLVTDAISSEGINKIHNFNRLISNIFEFPPLEISLKLGYQSNKQQESLTGLLGDGGEYTDIIQVITNPKDANEIANFKQSIGSHLLVKCFGSVSAVYLDIKPIINKVTAVTEEDFCSDIPLIYVHNHSGGIIKFNYLEKNKINLINLSSSSDLTKLGELVNGRLANIDLEGKKNFRGASLQQLAFTINIDNLTKEEFRTLAGICREIRVCGVMVALGGKYPLSALPFDIQICKEFKI